MSVQQLQSATSVDHSSPLEEWNFVCDHYDDYYYYYMYGFFLSFCLKIAHKSSNFPKIEFSPLFDL